MSPEITAHTDNVAIIDALVAALTDRVHRSYQGNVYEYPHASRLLTMLSVEPRRPEREMPRKLPVVRYWDPVLESLQRDAGDEFALLLKYLTPRLHWWQGEHYSTANMGKEFMANYALAEIVGPRGLCRSDTLSLGILLLGPDTYYPPHRHPAEEVLFVLCGRGTWYLDPGPTISLPPGGMVHIPSDSAHAFWSFESPMAAIYFCHGDVTQSGRLCKMVKRPVLVCPSPIQRTS